MVVGLADPRMKIEIEVTALRRRKTGRKKTGRKAAPRKKKAKAARKK
jgi:hypothetical protein